MISEAVLLAIEEILTRGPAIALGVRDFFVGNPGATKEQLEEKLKLIKQQQAAEEQEWASDLPAEGTSTIPPEDVGGGE